MTQWEPISNETHNQLGMLRHSWLKNKIINRGVSYVINLHQKKSQPRLAFENDIKISGDFDMKISLFTSLLPLIVDVYSPIHLINSTPLVHLPKKDLELIIYVFHNLYLRNTEIENLVREAEENIKTLKISLDRFRDLWFSEKVEPYVLKDSFQHFQGDAKTLYYVMRRLPKEIFLP